MLNNTRTFAASMALLLLTILAPASAHAWPLGNVLHLHPRAAQADARITISLFNNYQRPRDVTVDGRVYSVMPRKSITIKAPIGTKVFTETETARHHKGDLLVSLTPDRDRQTIRID